MFIRTELESCGEVLLLALGLFSKVVNPGLRDVQFTKIKDNKAYESGLGRKLSSLYSNKVSFKRDCAHRPRRTGTHTDDPRE